MHTLHDALREAAARYPTHEFLRLPARLASAYADDAAGARADPAAAALSYRDALAEVDALADAYRRAGYGRGHRIALLLENRPRCLLHAFAANAAGASLVPLNPDYRAAELEFVLAHSGAALAVALPAYRERLTALALPTLGAIIGHDETLPRAPAPAGAAHADECAVLYTSGTTGAPKGCVLGNAYALGVARRYLDEGGLCRVRAGEERLITPLPLFHMNALFVSTLAMVLSGGCLVQLDRFHPSSWWDEVHETGATIVHYLGVMPALLLAKPGHAKDRAHAVRFGFGANANPADHARFEARFGFPLVEAWAMTETGGGAMLAASREPRHVGTRCIGRPGADLALRIVDGDGRDVPDGEPGELLVRRAGADPRAGFFSGYLKDEAATAQAWRDGWFHTGDAVRRGPDGQVHFVDRLRNIIRRSGENIAALEVEAALADHPAVGACAVIAAPDALRDEEVMACVVPAEGAARDEATARDIQDWCLARLAYFKAPGWIAFIDRLPTTATNKVQKTRLADFGENPLAAPHCYDLRARKRRDAGAGIQGAATSSGIRS